ncbi:MAG: enoyl-CoA hydratase/isomerase family protein [Myxococcaceae bacterium]|nr:enoyl-CoA hydratase/isomerase family protein [Myxococcaceae bacterium]
MAQWKIERQDAVAVLSLDDGKANALTMAEFEGLSGALRDIEKSDASAVLLTGRAGYFSAGLNLKVLPTLEIAEIRQLITRFGEVTLQLFLFPKPVITAVSGHALGGGAIFALASDVRLLAQGPFKFGLNEVPAGLFVPTFGIVVAQASAPARKLTELVMHGRVLSPEECLKLDIAESLHEPAGLMPAALARAKQLGELSGHGYALTKRLLRGPSAEHAMKNIAPEVDALAKALGEKRG